MFVNFIESNLEEDIDKKHQLIFKNLSIPFYDNETSYNLFLEQKNYNYVPISDFNNGSVVRAYKKKDFIRRRNTGLDIVYANGDPQCISKLSKNYVATQKDQHL